MGEGGELVHHAADVAADLADDGVGALAEGVGSEVILRMRLSLGAELDGGQRVLDLVRDAPGDHRPDALRWADSNSVMSSKVSTSPMANSPLSIALQLYAEAGRQRAAGIGRAGADLGHLGLFRLRGHREAGRIQRQTT